MENELATLERDLARFERRVRLVWAAGLTAAVVIAVLGAGARQAQSQSASLSARALVLLDPADRQRIVLTSDPNSRPGIAIRDEAGKDRLRFGFATQPASPLFQLADGTGRPRLTAGFDVQHGDPQIRLDDAASTTRGYLGFGIQLRTPQMVLTDEHGKERLYAGWTQGGTPLVDVIDGAGNVIWKAGDTRPAGAGAGSSGSGSNGAGNPGTTRKSGAP